MKKRTSFKRSLTLHFVAVAVLPILCLGFLGVEYAKNKHLETISKLINAQALIVSQDAAEFLRDTSNSLSVVKDMLSSGLLKNDADINRFLQLTVRNSGSFESIFLLDRSLHVTCLGLSNQSEKKEDYVGLDFSAYDIFRNGDVLPGKTWSDTFLSSVTVEPSLTLGIPLEDGVLLGTVSLKKLSSELNSRLKRSGENFHYSVVDHYGIVIADTHPEVTSQRINLRMHPEVRNALDNKTEVDYKLHEDSSLIESVHIIPEVNWAVYVSLPVVDVLKGVQPLRYLLIYSLSIAGVISVVLSFWLSRRMLRPILLLRDTAGDVARGNYDLSLQPQQYTELEELNTSFREMTSAIANRERSISENQARYRELVNSIDGIVWELDLAEFRFTFVSVQAEQILGYPLERWLEEKDFWPNHVYPEDRDWAVSYCMKETEAQRDHDFEYRMVAADGRIVWLKDVVSVISENGKPVRLSGVMLDISTRKEAELVLQETTDRLQLLINRMPLGCILWDAEFKAQVWNPAAEKIFGFSAEEAIGKHPNNFLVPGQVLQATETILDKLYSGDDLVHSINENLTKDGRSIVCEWHNSSLKSPEGELICTISMVDDITQRISAEEAVKESEARFRTIFQTNPDAVLISRLSDGAIISINDNCLEMTGYSREEMTGMSSLALDLWENPDDRERYMSVLKQDGIAENFVAPIRIKNGRIRTALLSARIFKLNDQECVLNVIRDITSIKQAEERMARSEARFRALISVMGDGVMILGYNGEIIQCNQAAERILKMNASAVIGKMHHELEHYAIRENGEPFPYEEHAAAHTLKTGETVINQVMGLPQQDGQVVWVQFNTSTLGLDKKGRPTAVVVSFADVTELKKIVQDLRTSEKHLQEVGRQFQGVLEAIPDRILILDRAMRVVWVNWPVDDIEPGEEPVTKDLCCFELPGVSCGPLVDSENPLCEVCPVKKTFKSGRVEDLQKELPGGKTLSLRTFPVFNELGVVVNVIEIAQDITESLRQQHQAMRSGQLAALGELAAGVAHEINNPINGVINYAQLILNKAAESSREQELSQRIIRESERIATIVRELLYFAREEGHETVRVTVAEALDEVLALVRNQLNKQGIILKLEIAEGLPAIHSRSHQVQQLFLNLISNARYALTEKYPDVDDNKILKVSAESFEKNDRTFVRVIFRDHGTGIAPELLPKVLNPFTTTKPAGEGTGLGLSISHEIVQKHGGTINIDSVWGKYTEVVVELPVEGL